MKKYICTVCDWVYDPEVGDPEGGIAPGTAFARTRLLLKVIFPSLLYIGPGRRGFPIPCPQCCHA